jgi:hypothetical protein
LVACALLSGCFGGDDTQPSAAHSTRHHRAPEPTAPTGSPSDAPSSSSPTTHSSIPATSLLTFSPKSGGKHLDDCQTLVPGDDPAEFLYYPVVVTASDTVTVDSLATDHTQGVVDAGAWVAPTGPTAETGTFKGWPPPKIVTGDRNLQWSKRVPAAGATLEPGTSYNVFLRLHVDPTPGDSQVKGIAFTVHDASGDQVVPVWRATTTFSMSC